MEEEVWEHELLKKQKKRNKKKKKKKNKKKGKSSMTESLASVVFVPISKRLRRDQRRPRHDQAAVWPSQHGWSCTLANRGVNHEAGAIEDLSLETSGLNLEGPVMTSREEDNKTFVASAQDLFVKTSGLTFEGPGTTSREEDNKTFVASAQDCSCGGLLKGVDVSVGAEKRTTKVLSDSIDAKPNLHSRERKKAFYCQTCFVQCSNEKEFRDHLSGRRHAKIRKFSLGVLKYDMKDHHSSKVRASMRRQIEAAIDRGDVQGGLSCLLSSLSL